MSGQDPAANDAAELLYRHGIGSIAVSFVASTFLSLIAAQQGSRNSALTWWGFMTFILLLRAMDVLTWHSVHHGVTTTGERDIRRFGVGIFLAALTWAAYPLSFFANLNQPRRAAAAIILSGIAGGSATVLAPSPGLALLLCSALIWPMTIQFLTSPDFDDRLLGALGSVFFVVMVVSSRLSFQATMRAIRLSHSNQSLVAAMEEERRRTKLANAELKKREISLKEMNDSLEFRIKVRTADLRREVSEKERYATELAHLASTDQLTGLWNRAKLIGRLDDQLAAADRTNETLAVLFVDLDRFKEVNDVLGHYAGDHVLKITAERLNHSLLEGCFLARWGGDEFVAVFPNAESEESVIRMAEDFRSTLSIPIHVESDTVTIDATIGVALFPEHGRNQHELIWAADVAMYACKQEGRSKIRLFDRLLSQRLSQLHFLEKALHEAVETGAIKLVFEPIVSASDGSCKAMEALARWSQRELGEIPPNEFIPIAERTGDIIAIGRWALLEACREASTWPGAPPPAVSVNVSLVQVMSGSLNADVAHALVGSGLSADRLQLEVTESLFAADPVAVSSVLADLRRSGVRISLDDFGTGFSSFSLLRSLPIDDIKIDRSFVMAAEDSADPMLDAIFRMATALGFGTIAEGVETERQAEILMSMNAGYLQGHLFAGGALTPTKARHWLASQITVPARKSHAIA